MHECSSCRRGEIREEATVRVRGRNPDGRFVPAKYLCDEHLVAETDDGAKYEIVNLETEALKVRLNSIVRHYTGWRSFDQMCKDNPTLRPGTFPGVELLRTEYKKVTGREAYA